MISEINGNLFSLKILVMTEWKILMLCGPRSLFEDRRARSVFYTANTFPLSNQTLPFLLKSRKYYGNSSVSQSIQTAFFKNPSNQRKALFISLHSERKQNFDDRFILFEMWIRALRPVHRGPLLTRGNWISYWGLKRRETLKCCCKIWMFGV